VSSGGRAASRLWLSRLPEWSTSFNALGAGQRDPADYCENASHDGHSSKYASYPGLIPEVYACIPMSLQPLSPNV